MANEGALIDVTELAKLLGFSRTQTHDMIRRGRLPAASKIGAKRYFLRSDIDLWLANSTPSQDEFARLKQRQGVPA